MKVLWTRAAILDRRSIHDYVAGENPRAAAALDRRFSRAAERLFSLPERGRPGRVPGTREIFPHERYRLVDEIEGDTVRVLAIVHVARQWPAVRG